MLIILHPTKRPVNKGFIIDISDTIKLRVTLVIATVEVTAEMSESSCFYEIVVRMV